MTGPLTNPGVVKALYLVLSPSAILTPAERKVVTYQFNALAGQVEGLRTLLGEPETALDTLFQRFRAVEGVAHWSVAKVLVAEPRAHSAALAAFGLDSLLGIGTLTIVLWELNKTGGTRQARGLRLPSGAFLALGLYLLAQSGWNLWHRQLFAPSPLGTSWLGLTLLVMLALAWGKHRTGKQLNNPVLLTEGRVTLVDAARATPIQ